MQKNYGHKINEYIENLNNLELNIISLKSLEEKINKIPKVGKVLKEVECCDVCDGEGQVEWEFEHYTKTDNCPECYGYPELEKEIRSEDKTEVDVDKLISVNGLCYSIETVLELIQMCKDVGCSDLLYYRNYFKVGDMFLYKFSVLEPDIKEIEIKL